MSVSCLHRQQFANMFAISIPTCCLQLVPLLKGKKKNHLMQFLNLIISLTWLKCFIHSWFNTPCLIQRWISLQPHLTHANLQNIDPFGLSSCSVPFWWTLQQLLLMRKKHPPHRHFQRFREFKPATFHINVSTTNHSATAATKNISVVYCHPMIHPLKGSQKTSWDLKTLYKRSRFSMSSPAFPGYVWS